MMGFPYTGDEHRESLEDADRAIRVNSSDGDLVVLLRARRLVHVQIRPTLAHRPEHLARVLIEVVNNALERLDALPDQQLRRLQLMWEEVSDTTARSLDECDRLAARVEDSARTIGEALAVLDELPDSGS